VPLIVNLWQRVYVAIATLSWSVLGTCFLAHAAASYLLFHLGGEATLTDSIITFAYFYMTTATTVGYGDLSPSSEPGRLANVLVVLPGAIALFTVFLGKVVSSMGTFWRRRLQGLGDYSERSGHTIVVGWQGIRSRRIIQGLLRDRQSGAPRIVLLARGLAANPMPDEIDFVTTEQLSDRDSYVRAGADRAQTLIVRGADDDETLAATLAAHSAAPAAHIAVHFHEESAAALVRRQLPAVEVVTSIAADLLVRAARDPGASQLATLMFANHSIDTAYSMKVPEGASGLAYLDVLVGLKRSYALTLVGMCRDGLANVDLNCPAESLVSAADTLFYIADHRVSADAVDWASMRSAVPA
jgi:voltage-gated potassium channel